MASRQGAAVACRTDIFDISRYAVPSALDGRPLASILGMAGSGAVGLTGTGLGGRLKNSLVSLRKLDKLAQLAISSFDALYAPV